MSLKTFHLIFIVFAISLTIGFGFWALNNYGNPPTLGLRATATGSFVVSAALSTYFYYLVKKVYSKV